MKLVFVHGWGFTADFWNPVSLLLPEFHQKHIDLCFYGSRPQPEYFGNDEILIGHSLGFIHGITQKKDWPGWIAINSFARFINEPGHLPGCVSATELRSMKTALAADSVKILQNFYNRIGAEPPEGSPDTERLRRGLDELRNANIAVDLETMNAPGLVMAAQNDPLVPVAASEALGRLSSSNLTQWHKTGGHILPLANPVWCAATIRGFVKSHFG